MSPQARVLLSATLTFLGGCAATNQVGHFTALSTRVYERAGRYVFLGRYHGENHPLLGGANLEDAVEDALAQAPGGVYMTNVIVRHGGFPAGYAVDGDVYGRAPTALPPAEEMPRGD